MRVIDPLEFSIDFLQATKEFKDEAERLWRGRLTPYTKFVRAILLPKVAEKIATRVLL